MKELICPSPHSLRQYQRYALALVLTLLLPVIARSQQQLPDSQSSAGEEFRHLLHDLIAAANPQDPAEKKAAGFRQALLDHPEVLKWMAQGKKVQDLLAQADLPSPQENSQTALLIRTLDQIGHNLHSSWPQGPDQQQKREQLLSLFAKTGPLDPQRGEGPALTTFLQMVPDVIFVQAAEQMNGEIQRFKFSETDAIKMLKDPQRGFDVSEVPSKLRPLIENILLKYFDNVSFEQKRQILMGTLQLPPHAPLPRQLAVFLHHAGPVLQKIFQLFGRDAKSPAIQEVMRELQDQVRPFPTRTAREMLIKHLGRPIEEVFAEFPEAPLAAATVGQVYKATLKDSGEKVIIKFMRPGIREKSEEEFRNLESLTDNPWALRVLQDLKTSLFEELDFRLEYDNMIKGQSYNHASAGISAVRPLSFSPASQDVLLMEMAKGKGIDKYQDEDLRGLGLDRREYLKRKSQALSRLMGKWFSQALFGNGFLHADLHPGNIFLQLKPRSRPGFHLTLIDFGSVGQLTRRQQQAISRMMVGLLLKSRDSIMESFEQLGDLTPEQRTRLQENVQGILASPAPILQQFNDIIKSSIDLEIDFPRSFHLFNRGRLFLEKQLQALEEDLKLHDPEGKIPRISSSEIYIWHMLKNMTKETLLSLLGRNNEARVPLKVLLHELHIFQQSLKAKSKECHHPFWQVAKDELSQTQQVLTPGLRYGGKTYRRILKTMSLLCKSLRPKDVRNCQEFIKGQIRSFLGPGESPMREN